MPDIFAIVVPDATDVETLPVAGVPAYVDTTQEFLEYLLGQTETTASPPFACGRSGSSPPGTYLLYNGVPSNKSGINVPVTGDIKEIGVTTENAGNFTFSIESRVGVVYTEIVNVVTTASRKQNFTVTVPVTRGDELCIRVKSTSAGSPLNAIVSFVVKGSLP